MMREEKHTIRVEYPLTEYSVHSVSKVRPCSWNKRRHDIMRVQRTLFEVGEVACENGLYPNKIRP